MLCGIGLYSQRWPCFFFEYLENQIHEGKKLKSTRYCKNVLQKLLSFSRIAAADKLFKADIFLFNAKRFWPFFWLSSEQKLCVFTL